MTNEVSAEPTLVTLVLPSPRLIFPPDIFWLLLLFPIRIAYASVKVQYVGTEVTRSQHRLLIQDVFMPDESPPEGTVTGSNFRAPSVIALREIDEVRSLIQTINGPYCACI